MRRWGISMALYSGRHLAFKHNLRWISVPAELTQFAEIMQKLGIR